MEQDFAVYEFRMGAERFIFEAHNPTDAANYQKYALIHFRECLGDKFAEKAIEGPFAKEDAMATAPVGRA